MNKADQRNCMEQLLDQEVRLTNEQYLTYRRNVTERIGKIRREERIVRIVTKSAWAVTGIVFVVGGIIDFNRDVIPELVRLSLIAVAIVCLACATAFLAFYVINYRPRLRKAEQDTMLLTLQRELHELRCQLPQSSYGSPAAEGNDALPRP